jgi:hypothetical protein
MGVFRGHRQGGRAVRGFAQALGCPAAWIFAIYAEYSGTTHAAPAQNIKDCKR